MQIKWKTTAFGAWSNSANRNPAAIPGVGYIRIVSHVSARHTCAPLFVTGPEVDALRAELAHKATGCLAPAAA
jgi:hypothetical protein